MPPPITTNLQAHYDAQAITGLSDADPIDQWNDESGNDRHATASGTDRPTYRVGALTGRSEVRFNPVGSQRLLFSGGAGDEFAQPNTLFAVVHAINATTSGGVNLSIFTGVTATARNQMMINATGAFKDKWSGFAGANVGDNFLVDGDADTDPHYITIMFEDTSSFIRVDGADTTTVSETGSESFRLIHIATNVGGTSQFWNGDIAEILVYSAQLTTQEIEDTEAYLVARWFAPLAPSNPAAAALGTASIRVTWDDVADETGYRVERSPNGSTGWTDVSGNLGGRHHPVRRRGPNRLHPVFLPGVCLQRGRRLGGIINGERHHRRQRRGRGKQNGRNRSDTQATPYMNHSDLENKGKV